MPSPSDSPTKRRIRFERNASRVVFDPEARVFVVTWSKCNLAIEDRLLARRDPLKWVPSVSAVTTLYDRGCVSSDQVVYAALAVGRAWDAGDREGLDTEEAKKAAELVRDLATMCVDSSSPAVSRDVGQAMRHLLDEIAAVRFMNVVMTDADAERTLNALDKAAVECFSEPGFASWSAHAMRRRFLYCLNRHERTDVAYTLIALLFDTGSCPLLSLSDRRTIRLHSLYELGDDTLCLSNAHAFFTFALQQLRDMKASGRNKLGTQLSPQQLADSLSTPVESSAKQSNK